MAATVSAWAKPGAWALDSEEHESELKEAFGGNDAPAAAALSDFPSLSAAATTKSKKKKGQTISLQEFTTYGAPKPTQSAQSKGLTPEEMLMLPTGPRERTAEELERRGGFRSYGMNGRDESSNSRWGSSDEPRRQGSFGRDSNREFERSRADENDDWGATKKSTVGIGNRFERKERSGFFSDSQSRADESDSWNKSSVLSEGRRFERRVGFESNGGADSENWLRKKEEEGRKFGGSSAFDSLRDRRGGSDSSDSDNWGKKREEGSGSGRPRLNLQPRTLPVVVDGQQDGQPAAVKPKGSNPFGEARPREEVLKEKGKDVKEIEEELESKKIKDVAAAPSPGKKAFGSSNGMTTSLERRTEMSWRMAVMSDVRPQSAEKSENGEPDEAEDSDPKN